MRTPFLSLAAAAFVLAATPALAHADGDGAAPGGEIHCPIVHAPAAPRHTVRHTRRAGGCRTQVAREAHWGMAARGHGWASHGEGEYGRQDFSWAPTGPGDERPGPSTWRPGQAGTGPQGAPPPPAYAERGFDRRDFGHRDFDHRDADRRDQGEREFSQRFGQGEQGYGGRNVERRAEQGGMGERAYAFGYSHEEERSWSSREGGGFAERRACDCGGHLSATDQFGFLTWPGKTHFWRGQPASDQPMGPPPGEGGPAPWADEPQAPIIVHP